jgi:hypothetical protein
MIATALDFVRTLSGYKLCTAAKEYWGLCSSRSLAQVAVERMSKEAVQAVLSRGASVLADAPDSQSANEQHESYKPL